MYPKTPNRVHSTQLMYPKTPNRVHIRWVRQSWEALDVGENVGINVGENVGENERKILSIIAHTPQASAREMAEVLGITARQCERILASLKQRGLIARVGAAKGGHWKIRL